MRWCRLSKGNADPVTIIYRGGIEDTAGVLGIAWTRQPIEMIAFTGEESSEMRSYRDKLSAWLKSRGHPEVSHYPKLTASQLNRIIDKPADTLGWGIDECRAAIRLAGLPFPPVA